MAKFRSIILLLALSASVLALGAQGASAQSTRASVRASATILPAVGLQAPASLQLSATGTDHLDLTGSLQVTSPAPHVLTGQVETWNRDGSTAFERVRPGQLGTLPEEVKVTGAENPRSGVMRVTYTVAVVL